VHVCLGTGTWNTYSEGSHSGSFLSEKAREGRLARCVEQDNMKVTDGAEQHVLKEVRTKLLLLCSCESWGP